MMPTSYAEVLDDDPREGRAIERDLLLKSIELMRLAEALGATSRERTEAILFTSRLWSAFVEDLGKQENALPDQTRASLISIGLFILRRLDQIRRGDVSSFVAVIDISNLVAEGLT